MTEYGNASDWNKFNHETTKVEINRDGTPFQFGLYKKLPVKVIRRIEELQKELANDEGEFDILELISQILPEFYIERPDGFTDQMFMECDPEVFKQFSKPISEMLHNMKIVEEIKSAEKK